MTGRPLVVTAAALAVSLLVDLVVGGSAFPGYGALLGLGGSVAIIALASWLKTLLGRPEDVYPLDIPADVEEDLYG